MHSQSCTNANKIVPDLITPACGWIIGAETSFGFNEPVGVVRILINMPSNGHWFCHLSQYRVQTSLP